MFVPGDLIFYALRAGGAESYLAGIVVECGEGGFSVALPDGLREVSTSADDFVRAWLVQHAPGTMDRADALAFSARRLPELLAEPLVVVEP